MITVFKVLPVFIRIIIVFKLWPVLTRMIAVFMVCLVLTRTNTVSRVWSVYLFQDLARSHAHDHLFQGLVLCHVCSSFSSFRSSSQPWLVSCVASYDKGALTTGAPSKSWEGSLWRSAKHSDSIFISRRYSEIITSCVITLCVRKVITICVENFITFCVNVITFCGDYYILRRNSTNRGYWTFKWDLSLA